MSLQQLIRDAMAAAGDAMKAGEIREAVGAEDYTTEQVGAALYAMEKSGAIEKHGERGTYRYHLVPGWKPRRHTGGGPKKQPGAKVAAKAERRAKGSSKVVNVGPGAAQGPGGGVSAATVREHIQRSAERPAESPRADLLLAGVAGAEAQPDWPFETVMISRRSLRALVAAAIDRDGPLAPALRQALVEAWEAAA